MIWNSVGDTVPGIQGRYLVTQQPSRGKRKAPTVVFALYTFDYKWSVPRVSHWMELPEPAKLSR